MSPLRAPVSLQPSGRLASGGRDGDGVHRTSLARHLSGARGRDRRYPRRTPPPGREEREVCQAVPTTSVVFCLFFVSPRKHLGRMRLGFTCRTSCQQVSRLGGGSYIRGTFGDGQTGRGGATDLGGVHAGWAVLPWHAHLQRRGLRGPGGRDRALRGHRGRLWGGLGEPGPVRAAGSKLLCPELGGGVSQDVGSRGTAQWEPRTGAGSADTAEARVPRASQGRALVQRECRAAVCGLTRPSQVTGAARAPSRGCRGEATWAGPGAGPGGGG